MKNIIFLVFILILVGCGGGGGSSNSSGSKSDNSDKKTVTSSDKTVLLDDDFSKYQWHIKDTISNHDMGLIEIFTSNSYGYLGYNKGAPILVQIVDDGVDSNHEDLKDNINLESSYNDYYNDYGNPKPEDIENNSHGTQVGGLISAVGYNNIGLKGVAPSSNLVSYTLKTDKTEDGSLLTSSPSLQRAWFSGINANNISISNNSWGSCFDKDIVGDEDFLKQGAINLRDGKGRIYVFAAGNGREGDDSCPNSYNIASSNTSYFHNSQYSIAVAGVTNDNNVASYSSPGSNILVSGYTDDMGTTVPTGNNKYNSIETWDNDIKGNYTKTFSGTSASAPVVSGAIALVLEACPSLSYRDVKYLIAKTAIQTSSTFTTNSAGLKHSNDTGYGLINVKGMIDMCKATGYTNLSAIQSDNGTNSDQEVISSTTISKDIIITKSLKVEWVGLTISIESDFLEDLEVKLVSPSNTESILLHSNNSLGRSGTSLGTTAKNQFKTGFRLSSVAFIDENSVGTWKVKLTSSNANLTNLNLEVVGY